MSTSFLTWEMNLYFQLVTFCQTHSLIHLKELYLDRLTMARSPRYMTRSQQAAPPTSYSTLCFAVYKVLGLKKIEDLS